MTVWKGAAFSGALALLALGALTIYQSASARPSSTRKASSEVVRLEQELAALRSDRGSTASELSALAAEVRALKAQQANQALHPGQPGLAAPGGGALEPPVDIAEQRRRTQEQNNDMAEQMGNKLDGALRGDPIDRDWSTDTADSLKVAFAALPGSHLERTDCGSHLCRISVVHDDADEQLAMGHKLLRGPPLDQREVMFRYDWDSTPPRTMIYFAREGSNLKALSESAK